MNLDHVYIYYNLLHYPGEHLHFDKYLPKKEQTLKTDNQTLENPRDKDKFG